jgi:ribonuclease Z
MEIVFLGTSGSLPSPQRNVSAIAIKRGPEVILFDCGEGTQRQFMLSRLSFMQISKVLISHFHGDHFLGLPGLIMTMTLNDRVEPLEILGPRGTVDTVEALVRMGHFNPGFKVSLRDLEPGEEVAYDEYHIRCIRSPHTVPTLCFCLEEKARPGRFNVEAARALGLPPGPLYRRLQEGERVEWGGRTVTPDMVLGPPRRGRKIVYTSDTVPNPDLDWFARDCDVLIHEATVESSLEEKANEYGHSSARQAAQAAVRCGARRLFLTQISPRYGDPTAIEREAKSIFPESTVAPDFMEYRVPLAE